MGNNDWKQLNLKNNAIKMKQAYRMKMNETPDNK